MRPSSILILTCAFLLPSLTQAQSSCKSNPQYDFCCNPEVDICTPRVYSLRYGVTAGDLCNVPGYSAPLNCGGTINWQANFSSQSESSAWRKEFVSAYWDNIEAIHASTGKYEQCQDLEVVQIDDSWSGELGELTNKNTQYQQWQTLVFHKGMPPPGHNYSCEYIGAISQPFLVTRYLVMEECAEDEIAGRNIFDDSLVCKKTVPGDLDNICTANDLNPLLGNPVQVSTGNKVEWEPDYVDHRAAALSIYRVYNSGWLEEGTPHPVANFGKGWTHSHEAWLTSADEIGTKGPPTSLHRNLQKGTQVSSFVRPPFETYIVQTAFGDRALFYRFSPSPTLSAHPHENPGPFEGGFPGQTFERHLAWWIFTNERGERLYFNDDGRIVQRELPNGDSYHYGYEGGLMTNITNQFGRSVTLQYEGSNGKPVIAGIVPSHGKAVSYGYWGGLLTSVNYVDGSTMQYIYGDDGYLVGKVDELGNRIGTYEYEEGKAIQTQKAPGIDSFQFGYLFNTIVKRPRKLAITDVSVTTPLGETVNYRSEQLYSGRAVTPSARVKIPSVQDEPIRQLSYTDDALLESFSDYRGSSTRYQWNHSRRLPTSITEAEGNSTFRRTASIVWHPTLRKPTQIVEDGRTLNLDYDSRGNLSSLVIFGPEGSKSYAWTYGSQDEVLTETNANGAITTHTYDARFNRTSTTDALGRVTLYTQYDAYDRLLKATDPAGRNYRFTYDLRDRITSVAINDLLTQFTWRPNGTLAQVAYPNGHVLNYQYDSAQRMVGWSDNRNQSGSYTLDAVGNAVQESITDAQSQLAWQVHRTITDNNRLASLTQSGQTTQYSYDNNGDLTKVTNGLNESHTLTRDVLRRVSALRDPLNSAFTLAYNPLDALVQATDAKGVATSYERDALGNATSETTPDTGISTAQYDALGLPALITDAMGRATHITRDALGRPTLLHYADGASTAVSYHISGAVAQVIDPHVTTTYSRDSLGRVVEQVQTITATSGHATHTTTYSYVPAGQGGAGQLGSVTYPSGKTLLYGYDSTGRLTEMTWQGAPLLSGIGWNPLGQPTGWNWDFVAGTPAQASRSYNTAGQLTSTEWASLTWDAAARVSQIEQQVVFPQVLGSSLGAQVLPVTTAFTYDKAGRLTGYQHAGQGTAATNLPAGVTPYHVLGFYKATYAYDANGNRRTANYTYPRQTGAGNNSLNRSFTLNAGHNRIEGVSQSRSVEGASSSSTSAFTWDAAGSLLSSGTTSHTHNALAQVASSTRDGQTAQFLYNSNSQRVRKSSGQTTDYSYGLPELQMDNWPLGIYDQGSGGALATEIIYLPTATGPLPVAAEINGNLYAVHTDHLHTPRRLTNANGQAVWQWVISGFGEMPAASASNAFIPTGEGSYGAIDGLPELAFALRYPGQVEDAETGLFYNHHRYYDPYLTVGYTQADPIGLAGGWNRFAYVGGNPIGAVDWAGLDADALTTTGAITVGVPLAKACASNPYACVGLVGVGSYWVTDTYINPYIQPAIADTIDWCGNTIDDLLTYAKGGRQNVRDTGLIGVSDEEIARLVRDPNTSAEERKRLQKEQKARGERNKRKRAGG